MSKKQNNVEVVLPPSGSGVDSSTNNGSKPDTKTLKAELKTKISGLKTELKTAEKELAKLGPKKSSNSNNKTNIVKKKGSKNKK